MAAVRLASHQRIGWLARAGGAMRKRPRELVLWYWAFSLLPRARALRVAYLQPVAAIILMIAGVVLAWLALMPLNIGLFVSFTGLFLLGASYKISRVYHSEYPGRFNQRLEEYVARRVSRLANDQFIPQYAIRGYEDKDKIVALNGRVRQAIRVELRRLEQGERNVPTPVAGVLVIGPRQSHKTGALWHAMAHELKGWTFVQWPHHMDHPANLARTLGHRVALWVDDLNAFANPGEAAALTGFIQQVRAQGRHIMLLASCRDGPDLEQAARYFGPLMRQQQWVAAKEKLAPVRQLRELDQAYNALLPSRKSVLEAMQWLKSARVLTFPYQVLQVLNPLFPQDGDNQDGQPAWDEIVNDLSQPNARFVRSEQRADAKTRLSEEPVTTVDWLRYNLFNRLPRRDKVIVPINVFYTDQGDARSADARDRTSALEKNPEAVIEALAAHPVAAETLILLGDAYLSHLRADRANAGELAITCYRAALRQLDDGAPAPAPAFPGAWAAALVGKGIAELREGRAPVAADDFTRVATCAAPGIPGMLLARAWHGRGDALHAMSMPAADEEAAAARLREAAECYEHAARALPANDPTSGETSDPLWGETKLDRANVLYELAEAAAGLHLRRLADTPATFRVDASHRDTSPLVEIDAARAAYSEAQAAYSQAVAPAVWAEIQRRYGDLCLMEARCFLPAGALPLAPTDEGAVAAANPLADQARQARALALAKTARNYYLAARSVFSPSYLPVSWSRTQASLADALLMMARIVASVEREQAWDMYARCLEVTKAAVARVYTLAQAPLDWVDMQLLRAAAEIGRAPLDEGGAPPHYREATSILTKTANMLSAFQRVPGNSLTERMQGQEGQIEALRRSLAGKRMDS